MKDFRCGVCGKEFEKDSSLIQHKKDAHEGQTKNKKPLKIGKLLPYIIGLAILAFIVYVIYSSVSALSSSTIGSFDIASSFVPYRGNASANVNIIAFGDYQCPVCKESFLTSEPQILETYVNTGKVKMYFMDFAFLGPDSHTLSLGAWCANEQNIYYEYHDYIYSNQKRENSGWATPEKLKIIAQNIPGLDIQQFSSCLDSKKYSSNVQELTQLGRNSGVSGTPTFFIGNDETGYVSIIGSQPFSIFQKNIESKLAIS
ncbi:MAG TPA: DsbA family protein [archaeon]|nr:DsbA family protein [archaeon]